MPLIPVGTARQLTLPGLSATSATEESGVHDANRFGFAVGEDDHPRAAGLPPAQRPLTRRDIRSWTIASVMSGFLFATVAAVLLSRDGPAELTRTAVPPAPAAALVAVPAAPPVARAPMVPAAGVPLESLPLVEESKGASAPAAAASTRRTLKPTGATLTESRRRVASQAKKSPTRSRVAAVGTRAPSASVKSTSKTTPRATSSTKRKAPATAK